MFLPTRLLWEVFPDEVSYLPDDTLPPSVVPVLVFERVLVIRVGVPPVSVLPPVGRRFTDEVPPVTLEAILPLVLLRVVLLPIVASLPAISLRV